MQPDMFIEETAARNQKSYVLGADVEWLQPKGEESNKKSTEAAAEAPAEL